MKKALILILAAVFAFGAFAACDTEKTTQGGQTAEDNTPVYDPAAGIDYDADPLCIARSNAPYYRVVIPEEATETEAFAANELVTFVESAVGARMSVVSDGNIAYNESDKYISVGKTSLLEESGINFDYGTLNEEGFFIYTRGNLILMDGANQRGILYSVYDFLEKFVGIKFLTHESTYIPQLQELNAYPMEVVEAPYFSYRSFGSANLQQDTYFAAQMRMSDLWALTPARYGGGYNDDVYQGNDHSVFDLLPPEEYAAENEDWYCYSGESVYPGGPYSQLCLTNEEMTAQAIINLKGWIEEKPNAKYFMVGQYDMNPFCECKNCLDCYEENGGKSGALILFINKLADAVKEAYPDRDITIQTFAYQESLAAPVKEVNGEYVAYNKNVIPRDNVMVKIAIDKACFFHPIDDPNCPSNVTPYDNICRWSAITDRLLLWEYTCNFNNFLWWYPDTGVIKDNLLTYKEHGITGTYSQNSIQSREHYQGQLKCYLFSKLLWNPHRDVNALIKEFNTYHFGADIEPYIADVIDRLDLHYRLNDFHGLLHTDVYTKASAIPAKLLQDCIATLKEALSVVEESSRTAEEKAAVTKRIKSLLVSPQMMLLQNYTAYFLNDTAGRTQLATEFFANMDEIGMTYYKESGDNLTESLRASYL